MAAAQLRVPSPPHAPRARRRRAGRPRRAPFEVAGIVELDHLGIRQQLAQLCAVASPDDPAPGFTAITMPAPVGLGSGQQVRASRTSAGPRGGAARRQGRRPPRPASAPAATNRRERGAAPRQRTPDRRRSVLAGGSVYARPVAAKKKPPLPVTGDPDADQLLVDDPLALLIGMLLDQQVPMEWAFASPLKLKERLGGRLDAAAIAAHAAARSSRRIFKGPPALHRYPGLDGQAHPAAVPAPRRPLRRAAPTPCGPA